MEWYRSNENWISLNSTDAMSTMKSIYNISKYARKDSIFLGQNTFLHWNGINALVLDVIDVSTGSTIGIVNLSDHVPSDFNFRTSLMAWDDQCLVLFIQQSNTSASTSYICIPPQSSSTTVLKAHRKVSSGITPVTGHNNDNNYRRFFFGGEKEVHLLIMDSEGVLVLEESCCSLKSSVKTLHAHRSKDWLLVETADATIQIWSYTETLRLVGHLSLPPDINPSPTLSVRLLSSSHRFLAVGWSAEVTAVYDCDSRHLLGCLRINNNNSSNNNNKLSLGGKGCLHPSLPLLLQTDESGQQLLACRLWDFPSGVGVGQSSLLFDTFPIFSSSSSCCCSYMTATSSSSDRLLFLDQSGRLSVRRILAPHLAVFQRPIASRSSTPPEVFLRGDEVVSEQRQLLLLLSNQDEKELLRVVRLPLLSSTPSANVGEVLSEVSLRVELSPSSHKVEKDMLFLPIGVCCCPCPLVNVVVVVGVAGPLLQPCVALVSLLPNNNNNRPLFSSGRDACFRLHLQQWGVFVLTSSGNEFRLLSADMTQVFLTWSAPFSASRFWLSPGQELFMALEDNNNNNEKNVIHLCLLDSHSSQVKVLHSSVSSSLLKEGEEVLDILWQPMSLSLSSTSPDCLIGLLTSDRVLLLDQRLQELNSHICRSGQEVSSFFWIGQSLCFLDENGCCSFLTRKRRRGNTSTSNSNNNNYGRTMTLAAHRCLGVRSGYGQEEDGSLLLFSLPRNLSGSPSSVRVISVGCDTVTVAFWDKPDLNLAVCVRPMNPIEPLLLSLLRRDDDSFDVELIRSLVVSYFPYRNSSSSNNSRVWPSTQTTRRLLSELRNRNDNSLDELAVLLCDRKDGNNVPWVSDGYRFELRLRSNPSDVDGAVSELLHRYSDLHDLYLDDDYWPSEDIVSDQLPSPMSDLSKQMVSAGNLLHQIVSGESECKKVMKLFAMAGCCSDRTRGKEKGIRIIKANEFSKKLSTANNKRIIPKSPEFKNSVLVKSETNSVGERNLKDLLAKKLNGLVPIAMKCNDDTSFLALDLIEDFMAVNLKPETVVSNQSNIDFSSNDKKDHDMSNNLSIPSDWVDIQGQGKESDKLVGYYRFSDFSIQGEEQFSSVSLPGSRLVFLDISKYMGAFELFSLNRLSIVMDPDSSNYCSADQGEKHENVKKLCDVVFVGETEIVEGKQQQQQQPQWGMRSFVPRGSQLDVGLYQMDANRCKFTFEVNLAFAKTHLSGNRHMVAQRVLYRQTEPNIIIWGVFIDSEGAVCFESSDSIVLKTEPNCVDLGLGEGEESSESFRWNHLSVVIDSTDSQFDVDRGEYRSGVYVCVYVNGKTVAECTSFNPPKLAKEDIELGTVLFIAPNLGSGWRLTELRLWCDRRSESDISSCGQTLLSLAVKRKRVQQRLKGTKKMFSRVFRHIDIPDKSCEQTIMPISHANLVIMAEDADNSNNNNNTHIETTTKPSFLSPPMKQPKPVPILAANPIPTAGGLSGAARSRLAKKNSVNTLPSVTNVESISKEEPEAVEVERELIENETKIKLNESSFDFPAFGDVDNVEVVEVERELVENYTKIKLNESSFKFPAFGDIDNVEVIEVEREVVEDVTKVKLNESSFDFPAFSDIDNVEVVNKIEKVIVNSTESKSSELDIDKNKHQETVEVEATCIDVIKVEVKVGISPVTSSTIHVKVKENGVKLFSSDVLVANQLTRKLLNSHSDSLIVQDSAGVVHYFPSLSLSIEHVLIPIQSSKQFDQSSVTAYSSKRKAEMEVAHYFKKVIEIYTISLEGNGDLKVVSKVPMSTTKLVYWSYVKTGVLFLVTQSAGFTLGSSNSYKPVKLFDRNDISADKSWESRIVTDLSVSQDGWTCVCSCDRMDNSNTLVSLYHAKSGVSLTFAALVGCFTNDQLVLAWPSQRLTLCLLSEYTNRSKAHFATVEDCKTILVLLKDELPIVNKIFAVGKWIILTSTSGEVMSIERDDMNIPKIVIRSIPLENDEILSVSIDTNANLIIVITKQGLLYRLTLAHR